MSALRLLPVTQPRASLAIAGPGAATFNSVIEAVTAGPTGNQITLATVADGTGAGNFTAVGNAITYHYEDAVTTVGDFETTLAADTDANTLIQLKTAGTGANVLTAAGGDTFSATSLTGGGATASAAPTLTDGTLGVAMEQLTAEAVAFLRNVDVAAGTTKTATITLWGFYPVTELWYVIGALNNGNAIGETSADAINYSEYIVGLRRFSRLYAQIGTLGGAGTEVELYVDLIRGDATVS